MSKNVLVATVSNVSSLVKIINEIEPEKVYFMPSNESIGIIDEVISEIEFGFEYEVVLIENAFDTQECFDKSRELILRLIKNGDYVNVDYTGGSKTMTAGLALASSGTGCRFTYVGSEDKKGRDRDGKGNVRDGFEKVIVQFDPFETKAVFEIDRAKQFFNNYQFAAALKSFQDARNKIAGSGFVDDDLLYLTDCYIDLVKFYDSWDKFETEYNSKDYDDVEEKTENLSDLLNEIIEKSIKSNEYCLSYFENEENNFFNQMESNLEFLRNKTSKNERKKSGKFNEKVKFYLPDLLNNAKRRISERKFDDAVARLYRSIELIAQLELLKQGFIDYKKLRENKKFFMDKEKFFNHPFDDDFKSEVKCWSKKDFKDEEKNTFTLARENSYKFLEKLGVSWAGEFLNDENLKKGLTARNYSILAHGLNPIGRDTANDLYDIVLGYSKKYDVDMENNMKKAEFPQFNSYLGV